MIGRAYQAGWAGAVTKTFGPTASDPISPRLGSLAFTGSSQEPRRLFGLANIEPVSERPVDDWLADLTRLATQYPDRLTAASLAAPLDSPGDWQSLAEKCRAAGAMAIEANLSAPDLSSDRAGEAAIGQSPEAVGRVIGWLKEAVDIPVWAKLSPDVTDIRAQARAAMAAGADALTAINAVSAIIGLDLDSLTPIPNVGGKSSRGGLTGPAIKPIGLRCVADLAAEFDLPLAGAGGVTTWRDAVEYLLLGAGAVQICTAVMTRGYGLIDDLVGELGRFLDDQKLGSPSDLVGRSLDRLGSGRDLIGQPRLVAAIDDNLCISCDACLISCSDGAYQAISVGKDGGYQVNTGRCTGCSLCYHVCPVEGCIRMTPRDGVDK